MKPNNSLTKGDIKTLPTPIPTPEIPKLTSVPDPVISTRGEISVEFNGARGRL